MSDSGSGSVSDDLTNVPDPNDPIGTLKDIGSNLYDAAALEVDAAAQNAYAYVVDGDTSPAVEHYERAGADQELAGEHWDKAMHDMGN